MSGQAQSAVNHHSKQTNIRLFRLLMYLADGADKTGAVNPAPSQETLANFFQVSDRTIRNWLNILVESGELIQTRKGSGPGTSSAYQINLPMVENGGKGGKTPETEAGFISTIAQQMAEVMAEISALKAEILELKVEKVEGQGGKGGKERGKTHSLESADDPLRSTYDPGKGEGRVYIHPLPEPIQVIISALEQVVKTPHLRGVNEDEFETAAYTLEGWDATPETIAEFRKWWDRHGYYEGMPALSSLLGEYRNFLTGEKPSKNGRHPPATSPPQQETTAEKTARLIELAKQQKKGAKYRGKHNTLDE